MIVGPVFHFELVRIARRWQLYVVRFGFGALLLLIICMNYLQFLDWDHPWKVLLAPSVSIAELARFGQTLFYSMIWALGALVVVLAPGLVADSIAGERQRKTLHYLMNTRLWAVEIVLGKLTARMLHLGVFVAVVLPILSLLSLIGGIDPVLLQWSVLSIISTGYLLATLSILASATTRRPRDAFVAAYAYGTLFLIAPYWLSSLRSVPFGWWSPILDAFLDLNDWVWPASPLGLLTRSNVMMVLGLTPNTMVDQLSFMIILQVAYGTAFLLLACLVVRPAYRWIESLGSGGLPRRRWRRLRLWPRPPVGDAPIYWKEAHVAATSPGVLRFLVRTMLIAIMAMILVSVLSWAPDAFRELRNQGYALRDDQTYAARTAFNWALRFGTGGLMFLWLISLGTASAASIALEREQDTWLSLLATPLDGMEILRGKMLGPLRATAPLALPILLLWLVGLAAGSIHPLGLGLAFLGFCLFTWAVVALGTFASLQARTAWQAQGVVLATLVLPYFCCYLFPSPLTLTAGALISHSDFRDLLRIELPVIRATSDLFFPVAVVLYVVVSPLAYALGAWFLMKTSFAIFDGLAQRPWTAAARVDASEAFLNKPASTKTNDE